MDVFGVDAIVRLTSHFIFIYFTFWSMQCLRIDPFFSKGKTPQIRALLLLIATAIGFLVSTFFLECLTLIRNFILIVV